MLRTRNLFTVGVVVAVSAWAGQAEAQAFRTTSFIVRQFPEIDGSHSYELTTSQFGLPFFGIPADGGVMTAPDGTEFSTYTHSAQRDNFADFATLLFGDWTVVERPTTGPEQSYRLRVEPFSLNDVVSETPVITSPLPGSLVPTSFVAKWGFPSGQLPSGRGTRVETSSNLELLDTDFGVDGVYSVGLQTQLSGPDPGTLSLDVYTQTRLADPAIISRDAVLDGKLIITLLAFNSHSQSATFTVVPETATLQIACVLVFVITISRSAVPCRAH